MVVFVVAPIEHIEIGGVGMRPSDIRVVASPEVAAKILCTQPSIELVYNDEVTEGQIIESLRAGKFAMTKWRYADQKDGRTMFVLEAYPKEVEGNDSLVQASTPQAKLAMARDAVCQAGKVLQQRRKDVFRAEIEAAKASLPQGHRIGWAHSEYEGSHSERGYQDGYVLLAISDALDIDIRKVARVGHFSGTDNCRTQGWKLLRSKNVLEWDGEKWVPIDVDSQPNVITEEGYEFDGAWKEVTGESIYVSEQEG